MAHRTCRFARHAGSNLETRAENSFNVAVKFMDLMRKEAPDEKAFDLMMKAWMRAVKDGDFSKFKRTYRKYTVKDGG